MECRNFQPRRFPLVFGPSSRYMAGGYGGAMAIEGGEDRNAFVFFLQTAKKTGERRVFLLSQWLTFKLFGITYLVGKIKFKLLSQGPGRPSKFFPKHVKHSPS